MDAGCDGRLKEGTVHCAVSVSLMYPSVRVCPSGQGGVLWIVF